MSFSKNINKYKKLLLIWVSLFFLINLTFATDISLKTEPSSVFSNLFVSIMNLIWSIWYIFPIIAGKLMTNDLLYWSSLHFDVVLWHIWNFSRSMANFIVWFMFIYFIFKYLFSVWSKDIWIIKTNLPKLAIASIIINMSWFLMWVLIDLSTILIAWLGSLPTLFHTDLSNNIKIYKHENIVYTPCTKKTDGKACVWWFFITNNHWDWAVNNLSLKKLQSYETMISWPLYFIWSNILWINNSTQKLLNQAYDIQTKSFKNNWVAIKAIIKLFIFVMFLIPITILIITNIVRIFHVWIYIAFSPLIFLDQVFWWKVWWGSHKAFVFKNMMWLIFQPVLVVLVFSISIVFLVWIKDWLTSVSNSNYSENVKKVFLLDQNSSSGILRMDFWNMQDTNSSNFIWWFFGYLIISIFVIIILWALLKISFSASEITRWISDGIFKFSEDIAKTIPVPTPLWKVSVWSLKFLENRIKTIPSSMVESQSRELNKIMNMKPDIKLSEYNKIITDLDSNVIKDKKEWIKNTINILSWYKDETIRWNTKKLLTKLEWVLNDKDLWLYKFNNKELNSLKSDKDKLNYILENQSTILDWL